MLLLDRAGKTTRCMAMACSWIPPAASGKANSITDRAQACIHYQQTSGHPKVYLQRPLISERERGGARDPEMQTRGVHLILEAQILLVSAPAHNKALDRPLVGTLRGYLILLSMWCYVWCGRRLASHLAAVMILRHSGFNLHPDSG